MKTIITFILLIAISFPLLSEDLAIKIYKNDNSVQQIKLADINNITIKKTQRNFTMKIYKNGSFSASYLTSDLDSLNIESVNTIPTSLRIYFEGSSFKKYDFANIDSIIFIMIDKPIIDNIDPTSFQLGDVIEITGTGFGTVRGSSIVKFNNNSALLYQDWTDTRIQVTVPAGTTSGKLSVTVNGTTSNLIDYTIISPPEITSIKPTSFAIGEKVTITGKNFGNSRGSSKVSFYSNDASEYTSWTNTQIVCKVPSGTTSGTLTVTVNDLESNLMPYTIKIPVEMVLIPSGSFKMGNTGSGADFIIPETPTHQVSISNSFYMSKYEVQQDLYQSVMGTNPSSNKAGGNYPVDRISWYMACEFCNKLSDRDGYTKCYTINGTSVSCDWSANGYRLPTEAEWEYACKAGSSNDYYNGTQEKDLALAAWYSANSGELSHPVGQKVPNKWGLYDMHGNVWEHVWDWSGNYTSDSQTDPKGPSSGTTKILRGGSWHNSAERCRASMRGWEDKPSIQSSTDGIRLVRVDN